jgi:hypothetical protein
MGQDIAGLGVDRLAIGGNRFLNPAGFFIGKSKVKAGGKVAEIGGERFLELSDGRIQFALFEQRHPGAIARNAAWARLDRKLAPCLNLKGREAIGIWVEGDGQGQILAIRLESPRHLSFGAVADHYIPVDFAGRRLFTLIETESARWSDYVWNDGKGLYNVYRETIDFGAVETVGIWYNNLPKGQQAQCAIGPVKALPMVACTVRNPAVNGDCVLYGPKGEVITNVAPKGSIPLLSAGANQVQFSSDAADGPAPRVRLTVSSHGQPL